MDFEEFKNDLMELVTQELDNRGIENISLRFDTIMENSMGSIVHGIAKTE